MTALRHIAMPSMMFRRSGWRLAALSFLITLSATHRSKHWLRHCLSTARRAILRLLLHSQFLCFCIHTVCIHVFECVRMHAYCMCVCFSAQRSVPCRRVFRATNSESSLGRVTSTRRNISMRYTTRSMLTLVQCQIKFDMKKSAAQSVRKSPLRSLCVFMLGSEKLLGILCRKNCGS
jgi:hypothetical protein